MGIGLGVCYNNGVELFLHFLKLALLKRGTGFL